MEKTKELITRKIEEVFEHFDDKKKGYLTKDECEKFQSYLLNDLNYDPNLISKALKDFDWTPPNKLNLAEIVFRLSGAMQNLSPPGRRSSSGSINKTLALSTAELTIPAIRIVYILQLIKSKTEVTKDLIKEIDWCIDQIATGKIYESQLASETGCSSPTECQQSTLRLNAMPWLAQFSTPSISVEEIQLYLKGTEAQFQANKEQAAKRDQERVQRRSVFTKDVLEAVKAQEEFLATLGSENFSIFDAEKLFGRNKVLPTISYQIFQLHDLFNTTSIDENAFVAFVSHIRKGYVQNNPYHNDLHAADVLQSCHFLLTKGDIIKTANLSPYDVASLLISAIIHDYKHPGVTNGFLLNSNNDLATIYNDKSILENYHVSEAYKVILKEKDCNIFEKVGSNERKIMRKRIINCVLATDMAYHNELIANLQKLITIHGIIKGKNNTKIINPKIEFDSKQFLLNFLLHTADVNNSGRQFIVHKEWVARLIEEFGTQGDVEKSLSLPISFLCDRTTINVPVSQTGHLAGIIKPMFEKLVEVFPNLNCLLTNINKNEQEWKKMY